MKFLLDTDTCIYAIKGLGHVRERMMASSRSDLGVSVITESELRTGAAKSSSPHKTLHVIESFLAPLDMVPLVSDDARAYARLRATLERSGRPIGPLDTFIAAQAVARGLTLVTNNQREFRRVPGLKLENWG